MVHLPSECRTDTEALAKKRRSKGRIRPQLLTRDSLDGRTRAAQEFTRLADAIASDLGGEQNLTVIQRSLIEAFCGAALAVQDINARRVMGEPVDLLKQSQAISSMVRVATRLGLGRVARDVMDPLAYAATFESEGVP